MSHLLILNANPKQKSLNHQLADAYEAGYEAGVAAAENRSEHDIRRFNLSEMSFDPSLNDGYEQIQPLEEDLSRFLEALHWADHLLIVAPVWWGGLPAKFKGLIDRTFLPGQTFKYESENPLPTPLLTGKTARLVLTMDAPVEYAEVQAAPVLEQLNRFTLEFCGIENLPPLFIPGASFADTEQIQRWFKMLEELGQRGQ
ncbi:MAG: NAD(P)H-dependent oxidoreductase [Oceanospirillum sp.]|nr:NAD(P)H-dependent oxidoreductase [Oceanospirillum sp.]